MLNLSSKMAAIINALTKYYLNKLITKNNFVLFVPIYQIFHLYNRSVTFCDYLIRDICCDIVERYGTK